MLSYDDSRREGATATAILLHPHPDWGGDRHHPIIDTLYRRLPLSTVRFDFRSSAAEVALAQVAEAMDLVPGPVVLVGYSFGADVALSVISPRVLGWFAIAPPLIVPDALTAATDPRPKRLLVPERDQFSSPARAAEVTTGWVATSMDVLPHADHFLVGSAEAVLDAVVGWLPGVVGE